VGDECELWQIFRTGVLFRDRYGREYVVVDPADHPWKSYTKMTKIYDDEWRIDVAADPYGNWSLPVP
jgi:hypothetical protein